MSPSVKRRCAAGCENPGSRALLECLYRKFSSKSESSPNATPSLEPGPLGSPWVPSVPRQTKPWAAKQRRCGNAVHTQRDASRASILVKDGGGARDNGQPLVTCDKGSQQMRFDRCTIEELMATREQQGMAAYAWALSSGAASAPHGLTINCAANVSTPPWLIPKCEGMPTRQSLPRFRTCL